jgi:hypothetical protein
MKDYKNFINESSISSDYTFVTEVDDVTIYGLEEYLNKGEIESGSYTAVVNWMLQPDMKKDRIKSMDLLVTKVTCDIWWGFVEGDNGVYKSHECIEIDSNDFEIISDVYFEKDGGVCPMSVEIDYRTKKITVD